MATDEEKMSFLDQNTSYKIEAFDSLFPEDQRLTIFQVHPSEPMKSQYGNYERFFVLKNLNSVIQTEYEGRSQSWHYTNLGVIGEPAIDRMLLSSLFPTPASSRSTQENPAPNSLEQLMKMQPTIDKRHEIKGWGERYDFNFVHPPSNFASHTWYHELIVDQLIPKSSMKLGLLLTSTFYRSILGSIDFYLAIYHGAPSIFACKNVCHSLKPVIFYKHLGRPGDPAVKAEIETAIQWIRDQSKMTKELIVQDHRSSIKEWDPIFLIESLRPHA